MNFLFQFLGGIPFTLILLGITAFMVITGTLLESYAQSHEYAALFTYNHPLFTVLLLGFFINILVSALRRWPFQKKHIPFLMTHLGLLMILGGIMIKNRWGIQGTMALTEGSGQETILLPNTYSLHLKTWDKQENIPLHKLSSYRMPISLLSSAPHSHQQLQTWFRDHLVITGYPPFVIYHFTKENKVIPISGSIDAGKRWNILALKTEEITDTIRQIYIQGTQITISDLLTGKALYKGKLEEALQHGIEEEKGALQLAICIDNNQPEVKLKLYLKNGELISFPHPLKSLTGESSVTITLERTPTLAFLQDPQGNLSLFALDEDGSLYLESFRKGEFPSLIVYNKGFGGYAVQAKIPYCKTIKTALMVREASLNAITEELQKGEKAHALAPPLGLLISKSPEKVSRCTAFLDWWSRHRCWLYPEEASLPNDLEETFLGLNWNTVPSSNRKACYWLHVLFSDWSPEVSSKQWLTQKGWPFKIPEAEDIDLLQIVTQQLFSAGDSLPEPPPEVFETASPALQARFLTAYLRAYGIHLQALAIPELVNEIRAKDREYLVLECPIALKVEKATPNTKLEDNHPLITLRLQKGEHTDHISLAYDPSGQSLFWPVLKGTSLIRFQPEEHSIPHRLRLRQARQINYPNSNQPYSYEADLWITDLQSGKAVETTLSMNRIYETHDHYRFYLSGIVPPKEGLPRQVQIVVNYDPAKNFLTYPGLVILGIGIILLFWGFGKR